MCLHCSVHAGYQTVDQLHGCPRHQIKAAQGAYGIAEKIKIGWIELLRRSNTNYSGRSHLDTDVFCKSRGVSELKARAHTHN